MVWGLLRLTGQDVGSILTLIFLAMAVLTVRLYDSIDKDKRTVTVSMILSVLFSILLMFGNFIESGDDLRNAVFRLIMRVFTFAGLFLFIKDILVALYTKILRPGIISDSPWDLPMPKWLEKHLGLKSGGICFVCYLPYFLFLYPGILTPDSINQLEQAMGVVPYSNHHPWIHTLLIQLWVKIGYALFNNMSVAVSVYTFFQMIVMCAALGFCVKTIYDLSKKVWITLLALALFALTAYNGVYSVTMWKDVLFGVVIVSLICSMIQMRLSGGLKIYYVLFTLCCVLMSLLRSNGWYAFLVCVPIFVYFYRKEKKVMWPLIGASLVVALLVKGPVMSAFDVSSPDMVESLAIPVQMVARVLVMDRAIDEDDMALIEDVVDLTYIHELYVDDYADNIKELVRAGHPEVIENNKGKYLGLFVKLGVKYPLDYIDAYRAQTRGYWDPEGGYEVATNEGVVSNRWDIHHIPIIRGPIPLKIKEIAIKLGSMIPVYGLLWCIGSIIWITVILFAKTIIYKEKSWILFIPGLLLHLTVLIATPVAYDFRYIYFEALSLPLLAVSAFSSAFSE